MLEKNRLKAVEEIKTILEEHKQLYSILNALLTFKENNQYDEYINLLIQAQPILNKYRRKDESILLLKSGFVDGFSDYIRLPDPDRMIIEKVFKKYIDNSNPIYFYPERFVDKHTGRRLIGYKNLENEEDTLIEMDPHIHPMRIELNPESSLYGKFRSWYFWLLFQHNVDETYSILKKLEEADKTYYRVRKK